MLDQSPPAAPGRTIKTALLLAVSPRQAFYHLWLAEADGRYQVGKISGARGRPWHRQTWDYDTLAAAETFFQRRLQQKTNPHRRSRRHYRLVHQLPAPSARFRQLELAFDLE